MVGALHARGFQRLRIFPYADEMWWRCELAPGALLNDENGAYTGTEMSYIQRGLVARISTSDGRHPFGWTEDISAIAISKLSDMFLERFPAIASPSQGSDWAYAGWYQEMLFKTSSKFLPIAYDRNPYDSTLLDRLMLHATGRWESREMPLPPPYAIGETSGGAQGWSV